jgi:hypothetical protein
LAARLEQAAENSGKQIPFDFPFARLRASAKAGQALTAKAVRNDKKYGGIFVGAVS